MFNFWPPNIRKLESSRDVEGLIKALRFERDSWICQAVAEGWGLATDDWTRGKAAEALGRIGDKCAVEPLIAALRDKDSGVREAAVEALGKIGDARAVEPLIAAVEDKNDGVRKAAGKALSMIGWQPGMDEDGAAYWIAQGELARCIAIGAPAVEPLIAALRDEDSGARSGAAQTLGQIGDARAVDPLVGALRDEDSRVREAAARALGTIGDKRAVEPLIAALRDERSGVLKATAEALDTIGWQPGTDELGVAYWMAIGDLDHCVAIGAPAVRPLITALRDKNNRDRAYVAWKLGEIGTPAVEPLIAALRDQDTFVRKLAAEQLGRIGDQRAVGPIVAVLRGFELQDDPWGFQSPLRIAYSALHLLGWQPGADADGAWYWIAKGEWARCITIGSAAVEPLIAALQDPHRNERMVAAEALVQIFRSGTLDNLAKQRILAVRGKISKPHDDHIIPSSSDCSHVDEGIGVAF